MLSAYINDCLKRPVLIHSKELQTFVDMPDDVSNCALVFLRTGFESVDAGCCNRHQARAMIGCFSSKYRIL